MKVDVWSIGCIAYEMCEMHDPFINPGQNTALIELIQKIFKGK